MTVSEGSEQRSLRSVDREVRTRIGGADSVAEAREDGVGGGVHPLTEQGESSTGSQCGHVENENLDILCSYSDRR